ncbi:CoA-binding protein [Mesorhizobium sp. SARCC-RB16n]|nr:CoA-binding protein [Mesorhizobium sp. SARCC-RB16n]
MTHRLEPLLAPRSIAFVGASPRAGTPGNDMLRMIEKAGFTGKIYPVNPKYEQIEQYQCWPSIAALPNLVDLAVLSVANSRLEETVREVVKAKARAAVIFGSGYLENDINPPLTERISRLARDAGLEICGGNCMGFYNDAAKVWAAAFATEREALPGNITFISHAGSAYGALVHNDRRFRFNLAVSAGQELTTTAADYMDYALEQPETRVIGLFLEEVRNPQAFVAALEKAAAKAIPVVVLKVGRTEASAALAVSHSGAIAGNDAAYLALFDRHGVLQVDTLDELAATLLLFAQPRRPAKGGLAVIGDSGGEREMIVDLAEHYRLPFAQISPATASRLAARLEHGLEPVNPLDAWGTGHEYIERFADCFTALLDDPNTALGVFFNDLRDDYPVHEGFAEAALRAFARTGKPVAYATNYSRVHNAKASLALTRSGIPVLDGTSAALKAVRNMLAHRDFLGRTVDQPPHVATSRDWLPLLRGGPPLSEADALTLLADYGIQTLPFQIVESADAAVEAARAIGFPAVLKTAEPGILHKTERMGVILRLPDESAVKASWTDLASRIGPRVLVTRMAPTGVELALGLTVDPQFGPLVMVAAGGVWIEVLRDAQYALAPFGPATAHELLSRLRIRPLLKGARGQAPADLNRLAETVARFSVLASDLAEVIAEVDVNPIIASPDGTFALDALVVPRKEVSSPLVCARRL